VAANQSGRALCGFSAGGGVSHYGLLYYSDWFDYFGIWGCGESTTVPGDFNAYKETAAGLNIGETETALNPTAVCTRAVFASVITRFNEVYR
jgi:hypothetical protein